MTQITELTQHFLKYKKALNYKNKTLRTYRYNLLYFLKWLESAHAITTIERINKTHLESYLIYLSEHRSTQGNPLKPRSINKYIESVRCFFTYLIRRGHLQADILDYLEYVKQPLTLSASVLTHEQVRHLFSFIDTSSLDGYTDRTMLELLYSSGLRRKELLGLNMEDICMQGATIKVTGKGDKQRITPVGKTAMRHIESYLKAVRPFLIEQSVRRDENAMFLNMKGQRYPEHMLAQRIHKYRKLSDIEINITPHTFRRSCTTELIRGGANIYHVKELLGHETLETLKYYTRLTIEDLKKTHAACHPRETMEQ